MRALEQLNYLGSLSDDGELTPLGEMVSEFPLDPQLTTMLITSEKYDCSNECASIAALLSIPPVFQRPREKQREADDAKGQFAHMDGDHLTLLNAFHAFKQYGGGSGGGDDGAQFCFDNFINHRALKQADSVRKQLTGIMERLGIAQKSLPGMTKNKDYYPNIRKSILSGYFMQVAHLERNGSYWTVKDNQVVQLHPSTVLQSKPEWVLYNDFVLTSKNFIRTNTQVRGEWLIEVAPHYYETQGMPACEARKVLEKLWAEARKKGHGMTA